MEVEVAWGFGRDEHDPIRLGSGEGLPVTGRIDRIDQHPDHGWMALDYKTSSKSLRPDEEHRDSRGDWKDLQLPLYAALMESIGRIVEGHRLGYMLLAPGESAAGLSMARFTAADLDDAKREAGQIIDIVTSSDLLLVVEEACTQ